MSEYILDNFELLWKCNMF